MSKLSAAGASSVLCVKEMLPSGEAIPIHWIFNKDLDLMAEPDSSPLIMSTLFVSYKLTY